MPEQSKAQGAKAATQAENLFILLGEVMETLHTKRSISKPMKRGSKAAVR